LNYFLQRHVTRSLPIEDAECATTVAQAREHIAVLRRHWGGALSHATLYEFGAGWDLMIPLAYYGLGVNRQVLVDIRPLVRLPLVNQAINQLRRLARQLGLSRPPAESLPSDERAGLAVLKEHYGIDYRAPTDARATGLRSATVDYITSTNTLEHIPFEDIPQILTECRRLLRDDGVMSFRIDYQDHYAFFDRRISVYNFLQYSDRAWAKYNPALHYQNRLRHVDYMCLFRAGGFEVVEEHRADGSEKDLETLTRLPLPARLRTYPLRDVAVRTALVVLRKR
jgi:SAM-dependent methyltransferase